MKPKPPLTLKVNQIAALLSLTGHATKAQVLEKIKELVQQRNQLHQEKEALTTALSQSKSELNECKSQMGPNKKNAIDQAQQSAQATSNLIPPMREINYLVVHCTGAAQSQSISSIQHYWKTVNKWNDPGYHWIIKPDGEAVQLFPIEKLANGVKGYNQHSIHICYIGGVDAQGKPLDNRTEAQKATLLSLLKKYKAEFPQAQIQGHRDFPGVTKDCPSFDAKTAYNHL